MKNSFFRWAFGTEMRGLTKSPRSECSYIPLVGRRVNLINVTHFRHELTVLQLLLQRLSDGSTFHGFHGGFLVVRQLRLDHHLPATQRQCRCMHGGCTIVRRGCHGIRRGRSGGDGGANKAGCGGGNNDGRAGASPWSRQWRHGTGKPAQR